MINWIINYWGLVFWAVVLLALVLGIYRTFGARAAAPFAAVGALLFSFFSGKKMQRDESRKQVQDIEEKREKEYEKIDRRNTSPSDAADRLRDGRY